MVGAKTWALSGLLRGQQGSDVAAMVAAGARAVLVDAALVRAQAAPAERGLPLVWRAAPAGGPAAGPAMTQVEAAWREFYGFSAVIARSRRFGLLGDWRRFLAYFVVCRGLLTRYKRYGLSADSAVKGTKRRLATLLGKAAMRLMKRPAMPPLPSDQPQPYTKSAAA